MTSNLLHSICKGTLLSTCLSLAACVNHSPEPGGTPPPADKLSTGILLYGDSGYDVNYQGEDDYLEKFTEAEFLQYEYDSWVEDMRPVDEFEARPFALSPATGGIVAASGMWAVSKAMTDYCHNDAVCDYGIMLGDNIYPDGITGDLNDPANIEHFESVVNRPFGNLVSQPENFITYVTLGNHDWRSGRAGGMAEIKLLQEAPGFYMEDTFYRVKPPQNKGQVELFIIDTSMILDSIPVLKDELAADGSEASPGEFEGPTRKTGPLSEAEINMAAWLEDALKDSTARWKIVVAHHPIWSSSGSKFEEARSLREAILPIMCRYADVYLVGHEHTLEVHTDDCSAALGKPTKTPLVQILSGAASKQRPLNTNFVRHQNQKYPEHKALWAEGLIWGFAHMQIEDDEAVVQILSIPDDGSPDYKLDFEYRFQRRSGD